MKTLTLICLGLGAAIGSLWLWVIPPAHAYTISTICDEGFEGTTTTCFPSLGGTTSTTYVKTNSQSWKWTYTGTMTSLISYTPATTTFLSFDVTQSSTSTACQYISAWILNDGTTSTVDRNNNGITCSVTGLGNWCTYQNETIPQITKGIVFYSKTNCVSSPSYLDNLKIGTIDWTGAQGIQGIQGVTGTTGADGTTGATGATGTVVFVASTSTNVTVVQNTTTTSATTTISNSLSFPDIVTTTISGTVDGRNANNDLAWALTFALVGFFGTIWILKRK
jgi:hypothetical protein